jgi:SAM-dependent MidA family methyltransferase
VASLADLPAPDEPVILVANEFLDCLPIRQAVRTAGGWRERLVGLDPCGGLDFLLGEVIAAPGAEADSPEGAVFEWSDALIEAGESVGALVNRCGGAALFIDYGREGPDLGDTLQALRGHRKESPLAHPGEADLTAHVDFPAFLAAAVAVGGVASPIVSQGRFLTALGVRERAAALTRSRPDRADVIARQRDRLIAPSGMGTLFKVAAVHSPGLILPGLETES